MLGLGTTEILIFAAIILVLFGNRIPGTMRSLGQSLREFKRGINGVEADSELVNVR